MSKRVSAENQIETIVEQARVAEAASTSRMAFLQDVSVLCLVGLRQLAKEIDRLDRSVDVVTNGRASSRPAEAPAVELVELAAQLGDLISQVTTMTTAVEKLSKDVGRLSKDVKRLSKKKKKIGVFTISAHHPPTQRQAGDRLWTKTTRGVCVHEWVLP